MSFLDPAGLNRATGMPLCAGAAQSPEQLKQQLDAAETAQAAAMVNALDNVAASNEEIGVVQAELAQATQRVREFTAALNCVCGTCVALSGGAGGGHDGGRGRHAFGAQQLPHGQLLLGLSIPRGDRVEGTCALCGGATADPAGDAKPPTPVPEPPADGAPSVAVQACENAIASLEQAGQQQQQAQQQQMQQQQLQQQQMRMGMVPCAADYDGGFDAFPATAACPALGGGLGGGGGGRVVAGTFANARAYQQAKVQLLGGVTGAESTAREHLGPAQARLAGWQAEVHRLEELGDRLQRAGRDARDREATQLEARLRELRGPGSAGGGGAAAAAQPAGPGGAAAAGGQAEECQVCMERPCDTCLVPCGHTTICSTCAEQVRECPFCTQVIAQRVKMYR